MANKTAIATRPASGRWFTDAELRQGAPPAAVISHTLRVRLFGDAIPPGATLRVRQQIVPVVGEMPAGFDYPGGTDIWTPRDVEPPPAARTSHNVQAIARLRDGVSLDAAIADISAVSRRMREEYGDQTWMTDATAVPLLEQTTSGIRSARLAGAKR